MIYANQILPNPQISNYTLLSPGGAILTLLLASCEEDLRPEPCWS